MNEMNREQILALAEKLVPELSPSMRELLVKMGEDSIASYKAEFMKEVGEPVAFAISPHGKPISKGSCALEFSMEDVELELRDWGYGGGRVDKLFTSDQVAAAVLKAIKPLEDELAAAQEEIERLRGAVRQQESLVWKEQATSLELQAQLATEEQRVAEACAELCESIPGEEDKIFTDHDECAEKIRSGEYRKFMK